jgi:FAD/FMN-containing dehydrogenase
MTMHAALLDRLSAILAPDEVSTDIEARRCASGDLFSQGALCAAVITPRETATLAAAVAAATAGGFAIVPRGGGLTHTGGYTPATEAAIVVDTSAMNRIVSLSEEDMTITVQAGVTWKQVNDALAGRGLRLPFFGPFSGARATIGGGLSTGATYLGGARHGSAADIVLGLTVVLANGGVVHTGHAAAAKAEKPVYRAYGPDLCGLFVNDQGALGVKAEARLRLIRAPEATDFLSFVFADVASAARAASEVGRSGAAEDAYVIDPSVARARLAQRRLRGDLQALRQVVGQETSLRRALVAGFRTATGSTRAMARDFSLHLVCAGRSRAAVAADMAACRAIARRFGGREVASTAPRLNRANPFPPITTATGRAGGRWAAVNAKVAHSDAVRLIAEAEAVLARHGAAMTALGVERSLQLYVISTHVFHYECMLWWADDWLPLHRQGAELYGAPASEPRADPPARALAALVRQDLLDLFKRFGAASNQLGRAYDYVGALRPHSRALLEGLKRQVDPKGLMNPGVLGL